MSRRQERVTSMLSIVLGFLLVVPIWMAFAAVEPANLKLTCFRGVTTSGAYTNNTYYQGDKISFTNSKMYTGSTTSSAYQNFSNVTFSIRAGQMGSTNYMKVGTGTFLNTAIGHTNGRWWGKIVCPTCNPAYIQVSISDTLGNTFTYPMYRVATQAKLP